MLDQIAACAETARLIGLVVVRRSDGLIVSVLIGTHGCLLGQAHWRNGQQAAQQAPGEDGGVAVCCTLRTKGPHQSKANRSPRPLRSD
ncbi:hypothetical protein SynRCC2555_01760 [Synechococcus sp. WH 8101]|nr:hypothetical protein SynRCC2555_01760 [Synechococcus sp. WH 8101]